MSAPDERLLNQDQLAKRWNLSSRSLERWRWRGEGPRFVKLGGAVRYRLEDILTYEAAQARIKTSQSRSGP
jgi:hypothetical protein